MQCSDVTRELAAPTGDLAPIELQQHLANCPDCAAWNAKARRLDRLWAATRPAEPCDADFDRVWAHVTQSEAAPQAQRAGPRFLPLWGVMAAGLALAAAVLLALVPMTGPKAGVEPGIPRVATTQTVEPVIEVEAGQVLFIHVNGDHVAIVRRARPEDEEMAVASADVAADFELWVRSGAL
ncbi:MAG: hypothetical protein ABI353_09215 [Isosphaeraceae bacterium]